MLFLKVLVLYMATGFLNAYATKKSAIGLAQSLVTDKGIINIGSGCSRTNTSAQICQLPEVVVNVDMNIHEGCTTCLQADLETGSLPFSDKLFDVAFASHVLEHLNNWQDALNEWTRIADNVIVVLPHPLLDPLAYINPLHVQHFSLNDIAEIKATWPQVTVLV